MENITFGELERLITECRDERERDGMYFTNIRLFNKNYGVHDNSYYSNCTMTNIFINDYVIEFNYCSNLIFVKIVKKIPDLPDEIQLRNTLSKLKDIKVSECIELN